MKARCPLCGRIWDSTTVDLGWYFACCGFGRLRWVEDGLQLYLEVVPEDQGGEDYDE